MLDQIKIASPCSAKWEQMEGTDRVRFCGECKKNVFNLSAMTRREAEELIKETNGNLCTMLFRRADGTVLTADCPVGRRVKAARVRRRIGWAIAGAMGCSTAWAQTDAVLTGIVKDAAGAPIVRASVNVINERTGARFSATSDESGRFRVIANEGIYTIKATSMGFSTTTKEDVVAKGEVNLQFELMLGTVGGPIFLEPVKNDQHRNLEAVSSEKRKPWWRRIL
jgi:hypothetical protein